MKELWPIIGLVVLLVLIMALAAYSQNGSLFYRGGNVSPTAQVTPMLTSPLSVNFTQEGNLSDFDANAGKETGVWSLIYEKPGKPVLKVKLNFVADSQCENQPCNDYKLTNGARVAIKGNTADAENPAEITVITLSKKD